MYTELAFRVEEVLRGEAQPGETVRIRSAHLDGAHYFSGDTESGHCFDAEVELTEPETEGEAPLPYYA